MDTKSITKEATVQDCTPRKKVYSEPVLSVYGDVRELTTGGSTGVTENNPPHPASKSFP